MNGDSTGLLAKARSPERTQSVGSKREYELRVVWPFANIYAATQAIDRHSNAMATEKFPAIFASTRTTLPRALKRVRWETPIAKSTVEPTGIGTALDRRIPPTLIFSD